MDPTHNNALHVILSPEQALKLLHAMCNALQQTGMKQDIQLFVSGCGDRGQPYPHVSVTDESGTDEEYGWTNPKEMMWVTDNGNVMHTQYGEGR